MAAGVQVEGAPVGLEEDVGEGHGHRQNPLPPGVVHLDALGGFAARGQGEEGPGGLTPTPVWARAKARAQGKRLKGLRGLIGGSVTPLGRTPGGLRGYRAASWKRKLNS